MNAQIAIRGVADAFDDWAKAGCEGWAASDVLPIFSAIEDDPEAPFPDQHGKGGPIPVYRAPVESWGPVDRAVRDAALGLGYPWHKDLNVAHGEGVACYPINNRTGRRVSTNEAYLEPARNRPNLTIVGEALVDRVTFDGTIATGVRVRLPGQGWTNLSAAEVVLSAGAVHSPGILIRSGLWTCPGAARSRHCSAARPAGRRWQPSRTSHPSLHGRLEGGIRAARPGRASHELLRQLHVRHGRRGTTRHADDRVQPSGRFRRWGCCSGRARRFRLSGFFAGKVRFASPDPDHDPLVEANMLSDPRDVERMRDALRRGAEIVRHPAIARVARSVTFGASGLSVDEVFAMSEDERDRLTLLEAGDAQHAAGTCRMTAKTETSGVVNSDGSVKGVQGLRVADASIMPLDCRANTHFTSVMIGEIVAAHMKRAA